MTTTTGDVDKLEGGRVTLTQEQLNELEARVDGPLLRAGDEGWGHAVLVWNGMVARFLPSLGREARAPR
jgi:hypothetical protein